MGLKQGIAFLPFTLSGADGFEQDFGATGLRIGCLVSQSNTLLLEAAEGIS